MQSEGTRSMVNEQPSTLLTRQAQQPQPQQHQHQQRPQQVSPQSSLSATSESTSSDQKRKRLTQACDMCRKKKIRCDGGKPFCANCVKLNRECTYLPSTKKRGPRQGYIEMLEKRLDKMEKMLYPNATKEEQDMSGMADSSMATNTESAASVVTTVPSTPSQISSSSALSPTSSLSSHDTRQISARAVLPQTACTDLTADMVNTDRGQNYLSPKTYSSSSDNTFSPELPPESIIEHLIDVYVERIYPALPIVDYTPLLNDIRKKRCSLFLLFSLMAVAARYSDHPDVKETPRWQAGEKYACHARGLLTRIMDDSSVTHVQGLILLSLHEFGCARGPRHYLYSGIAIRMALELGLNKELNVEELNSMPLSEQCRFQETRRRVYWIAFTLDKFSSAATGRPIMLQEEDSELLLPGDETAWTDPQSYTETLNGVPMMQFQQGQPVDQRILSMSPGIPSPSSGIEQRSLSSLAYLVRAVALLGRVTTYINRGATSKDGRLPFDPQSDFACLDRQLDRWANQLPNHFKYTHHNIDRYLKHVSMDGREFFMFHVLHNASVVLLHRPSLVLLETLSPDTTPPEVSSFINASMEKCMKAVENVSDIIKNIHGRVEVMPPFMTYLVYTVATVVVNNSFSSQQDVATRARKALGDYFKYLQAMRGDWAMADKLYFMIRDLYSMHCNVARRRGPPQQQPLSAQATMDPPGLSSNSSSLETDFMADLPIPFDWWPPSMPQANEGQQNMTPPNLPQQPASVSMESTDATNLLTRKVSFVDMALSTCDGASCTDWLLGDTNDNINIATAFPSLGRSGPSTDGVPSNSMPRGFLQQFLGNIDLNDTQKQQQQHRS